MLKVSFPTRFLSLRVTNGRTVFPGDRCRRRQVWVRGETKSLGWSGYGGFWGVSAIEAPIIDLGYLRTRSLDTVLRSSLEKNELLGCLTWVLGFVRILVLPLRAGNDLCSGAHPTILSILLQG